MVLHRSDLGTRCYENRDLPAPSRNLDDQDKTGYISGKKRPRLRTEESNDQNNTETVRKKKVKKNYIETEDESCFVAIVTASNLHKDALHLPQDFTSSIGLKSDYSEIIVRDERERSWALDLRFNKSSDTFYITRGWTSFCGEIGKKAGGVFVFKLVGNGETPMLSFCSTESINDGRKVDKKNEENCMELKRKKKRLRCRNSTSLSLNRFVTLTLPHDLSKRLGLPFSFRIENGIHKPGVITMLGKDGRKSMANLHWGGRNHMYFGKGLKDFAKANGLKGGESFTLEAVLENGTPMLRLFSTQSTSDRSQQEERLENSQKEPVPASLNSFVTLRGSSKYLPLSFARENGLDKPGIITLVGKDGAKWDVNLLQSNRMIQFGRGWTDFANANGLNSCESFTLEAILENGTPMLSLFSTQPTSDRNQQGKRLKVGKKESFAAEPSSGNKTRKDTDNKNVRRDSFPPCLNRFVTLTLTDDNLRSGICLPCLFVKENGLDKPRNITLIGTDATQWDTNLRYGNKGSMYLGKGLRDFARGNGLKCGESFTLEAIWENKAPTLRLVSTQSTNDRSQQRERLEVSEKDSVPASLNPFLTLNFAKDSRQLLPLPFARENGLDKLRIITLVGKDGSKWDAKLLQGHRTMYFGCGLKDFANANGVQSGESFTLKAMLESGTPMLCLVSTQSTNDRSQQGERSKDSQKDLITAEPSSGKKKRKDTNNRDVNVKKESFAPCLNRFVTLTLTDYIFRSCKILLPMSFARENGLEKSMIITLVGKDGEKWDANLRWETKGSFYIAKGFKDFATANNINCGESFTLEANWENGTFMLSLLNTKSTNDRSQQRECSKDRKKELISTEPSSSGDKRRKDTSSNTEEKRDSSSAIQKRFVTLTLTPEDIRDSILILPSEFMKDNDINRLGKIILLGKNRMKWFGYLLSKDGIVAVGCGWKDFCEANGVKTGKAFSLECINGQDTTPVFKFCSNFGE